MIPKRNFSDSFHRDQREEEEEEEEEEDQDEEQEQEPKRRFTISTLVMDVMKRNTLQQNFMKMEPFLEPFLRKVVKEEVERVMVDFFHSSPSMDQFKPGGRTWQLRFSEKLPPVLFTNNRVESYDGKRIRIDMWDVNSNKVVTSGSLSSIKAEIMVVDSNFKPDDEEDWTEEAFKTKILREREGKRPLLTGELTTCLKDGVGYFGDISFSDNSSWVSSRKFRLAARIVPNVSTKSTRVREAISEAFVVKDHRGESNKKHYPPKLEDPTWRLEKISRDGIFHKRLISNGIITVKDFLRSYYTNQSKLRKLLGGSGNSSKMWETIVEHANTNTCTLNAQRYVYYKEGGTVGLIFDYVHKNVGVTFNGQSWLPVEELTALQMGMVESLKCDAYENTNQFVPFDRESIFVPWSSLQLTYPFNQPSLGTEKDDELKMQLVRCDSTDRKNERADLLLPLNINNMGDPIYDWGLDDEGGDPSMGAMNFGHTHTHT